MDTKSFYTIAAPNTIRPHSEFNIVCNLTTTDLNQTIILQFQISGRDHSDQVIFFKSVDVPIAVNQVVPVKIQLDDVPNGNYKLKVHGLSGLLIDEEKNLQYNVKTHSTIIQTDKSMYKPGDKVQFRVLFMDSETKPLPITEGLSVHILDNMGNRVVQWKDVVTPQGVFKADLQLSSNPVLGVWQIIADLKGVETRKVIHINEYVLPKFEVTVKAQENTEIKEGKIVATISAKYTYGKSIKGNAKILIYSLSYLGAPKPNDTNLAVIEKTVAIDGRQVIDFDMKKDLKIVNNLCVTYLLIDVSVEEELTGRVHSASTTVTVREKSYNIQFIKPDKFKPGLPYTIAIKVSSQNDGPVENTAEPLKVEYIFDDAEATPIAYQVGKTGVVTVTTNVPKTAKKFAIKAKYLDAENMLREVEKDLSKSNTYIRAQVLSKRVANGKNIGISVQATETLSQILYYVIGRGSMILSGRCVAEDKHTLTFDFLANFQMVPKATLLVFYIRSDGEIVSDRLELNFEDDLNSKLSLELSPGKAAPGDEVTLTIKTTPKSYTALLGVDQSVLLLKDENDLTRNKIFEELKQYDLSKSNGWSSPDFQPRFSCGFYRTPFTDNFDDCGLVLVTNATKPKPEPEFPAPSQFGGGMLFASTNDMRRMAAPKIMSSMMMEFAMMPQQPIAIRKEFPETWLWEDFTNNSTGEMHITKKVPDTITSWIITGFSLNADTGLALTKSPTKLTVFRPFFVSATLPYSVKRGEVLKIPVTVFNYTKEDVTATVVMENTEKEFEFTDKDAQTDQEQEVLITSENGSTVFFSIKPTKVGYIMLKIIARTDKAGDGIEQPLLVIAEGTTKYENKAVLLDLRSKSEEKISLACEIPTEIIPDSVKVELAAVGDILGPTISNLDDLVSIPCGCGEQTLILMVPSILVYQYLQSIDKMTAKVETKIKSCISIGYQNELTFQHYDGSFSAFGNSDAKGSVWLTAFAVKSFTLARKLKFDLDQNVIDRALEWLCANQADNGSFPEVGNICHKDMQGDAGQGLALTVYTTIALIQSVEDVFNNAKFKVVVNKAVAFISDKIEACNEVYTIAMAAYCLQLAKHDSKEKVLNKLNSKATLADDRKYWVKPTSQTKPQNTWCIPSSVNVEITSYALLAFLEAGQDTTSIPILKWLIAQRNNKGGGESTQDTVMSLQAIATFANKIFSSAQSLEILATSTSNSAIEMKINKENSLVLQKVELSDKTTDIEILAKGSGVALVQVAYQYNVNDDTAPIGFKLDVKVNSMPNSSVLNLIVSANFIPITDTKVSNMALLEISFPSGYCFDSENKESILAIPKVKKVETENSDTKLVIYCDNIDENGIIIPIAAMKMFDVSEHKPSIVEIYDYYDNARRASKYYSM